MPAHTLDNISDAKLLTDLAALVATDRQTTAALLAHLAEVDARQLYRPAAFSSMHVYCTRALRMADEVAYKRIRVARIARRFPQILDGIADGRFNVSNVVLLAPHLSDDNVDDVLTAATHRSKAEIEILVARLAPQLDVPTSIKPVRRSSQLAHELQLDPDPVRATALLDTNPTRPRGQLDPGPAPAQAQLDPDRTRPTGQLDPDPARALSQLDPDPARALSQLDPVPVVPPRQRPAPRVKPLAPERFALQVTISQATRDKLERARALMRHRNASGDLAEVLDRALDALLTKLEKEKFGATSRPRARRARTEKADPRYVQNAVKREVHERDGEQCTFVSADGVRCTERGFLELDHRTPVALGGQPDADEVRLLCKPHNQYEAERILGADFMRSRRKRAAAARAIRTAARATRTAAAETNAAAAETNGSAAMKSAAAAMSSGTADAMSSGTADAGARGETSNLTTYEACSSRPNAQEPLPGFRCSEGTFGWPALSSWAS